jgi:hypothetical protein
MNTTNGGSELPAALSRALDLSPSLGARRLIDGRVGAAMSAGIAPRRRSARLGRGVVLAAVLLALAVPLAWAVPRVANLMTAPNTPEQFNAEVAAAMRTIPVPPGYAFPDLTAGQDSGFYGENDGLALVEGNAVCAWLGYWLDRTAAGDAARATKASSVIKSFPTWRSYRDPELADQSYRDVIDKAIVGVASGDTALVTAFTVPNCP